LLNWERSSRKIQWKSNKKQWSFTTKHELILWLVVCIPHIDSNAFFLIWFRKFSIHLS
jgi:hypothetical protein